MTTGCVKTKAKKAFHYPDGAQDQTLLRSFSKLDLNNSEFIILFLYTHVRFVLIRQYYLVLLTYRNLASLKDDMLMFILK